MMGVMKAVDLVDYSVVERAAVMAEPTAVWSAVRWAERLVDLKAGSTVVKMVVVTVEWLVVVKAGL